MRAAACACELCVVKYGEALQLQERLVADRKAGHVGDLVLSLQHPASADLHPGQAAREGEVRPASGTERGGDVTFHEPRQTVL
jgi:lipoyl(octanoyl) transferase